MAKTISMLTTIKGSLLERFYPKGWNLKKIDACCAMNLEQLVAHKRSWHAGFEPAAVESVDEMDRRMGEAIADQIEATRREGRRLAIILPVGPMGMYKTVVERIRAIGTSCDHVTTFNMDEWSDAKGNTMPGDQPGGFEHAMTQALFEPLGEFTVPAGQRNFATRTNLPTYPGKIASLRKEGARLVTVYGIGRVCHIAFWEPQLAGKFKGLGAWKKQTHKLGVALHPLTVEQNSLHSFMSRFTLIPCFANTIGPGLFLKSDYCIGGADGVYPERGASWQSCSLCITLGHAPTPWLPSTWMPTMAGRLFFMKQLAGPLLPESH
jgi:glucosamine-6-phosphate deaminase